MLGKLALQRTNVRFTHLTALAVMASLVVGLFGVMGSARAAIGDVSATSGWCLLNTTPDPDAYQLSSDAASFTAITVQVPDANSADDETGEAALTDDSNIDCSAANANQKVRVTPNGSISPTLEFLTHMVEVTFAGTGKAGQSVGVSAKVKNAQAGATYSTLAPATTAQLSPTTGGTLVNTIAATTLTPDAARRITDLVLLPSAAGTYAVTINVSHTTDGTVGYISGQASFGVGETAAAVSKKVASAMLELDYVSYDDPKTSKAEGVMEDGTEPASNGDIWLRLSVKNDLDKPAADADISSVTIIGPNGTLGLYQANDSGTARVMPEVQRGADGSAIVTHDTAGEVTSTMYVKVTVEAAASVNVQALINGTLESNTVPLVFTGATSAVAVTEATDRLEQTGDELKFTVTGADKDGTMGTDVAVSRITAIVRDSEGNAVSNPAVKREQGKKADGTTDDNSKVVITVSTGTTAAPAGEYTLDVLLGSDSKTKQSTDITVAGPAADIELTADPEMASTVGEIVDLTATVTDENGALVPDGTAVKFSATSGGGAAVISAADTTTKDGVATATLGVSSYGTTFVYASSGDARGTVTFVSTAGEPEAMPAEEASLSCLSETNSFSTWTCEVDSSASEVFGWVNSRGASAIHLWNGSAWVRYSVVEGATVPGSSDFQITQYNQLYISN